MEKIEKKQNTKFNGFRFNDAHVAKLKNFEAFKACYKGSAYVGLPNQDDLLKQAWEIFNPPTETKKAPASADSK